MASLQSSAQRTFLTVCVCAYVPQEHLCPSFKLGRCGQTLMEWLQNLVFLGNLAEKSNIFKDIEFQSSEMQKFSTTWTVVSKIVIIETLYHLWTIGEQTVVQVLLMKHVLKCFVELEPQSACGTWTIFNWKVSNCRVKSYSVSGIAQGAADSSDKLVFFYLSCWLFKLSS